MSIAEKIRELVGEGFCEIGTDSGTGSRVLVNNENNRVAKINEDKAYDEFIRFAQDHDELKVPQIFEYEEYENNNQFEAGDGFSFVLMEQLTPLNKNEKKNYEKWIQLYFNAKENDAELPPDDFDLIETINQLFENAKNVGVNLDLCKASNIMKRDELLIVIDPYS